MKLPPYIKSQPHFWQYIPFLNGQDGTTIGKTIYLKPRIYQNLQSHNPTPANVALLLHEKTHRERISHIGVVQFTFQYLLSPQFRLNEELKAIKASFKYLKEHGESVDLKRKARILSGWQYLKPVSYEHALERLQQAWEEA